MVSLRSLVTGAVALMAATVNAALTPQQIADGINRITEKSRALQEPAQSITIVNAPLIVIGQGPFPKLITGFTDIVTTATVLISQLPGTKPIQRRGRAAAGIARRGPDAELVYGAFRGFTRVLQELLNIMIGKAGLLTKVPFVGPPVANVLRSVEGVVDQIAITLIDTVPSRSRDLESEANSLGATLDLAIHQYEGLQV